MTAVWRRVALVFAALGVLGAAVAVSGVVDISARSGHWPVTNWALHFAMRRSVQTHALGISVPELDHEALVARGAGHYASGCAPCHGAPGAPDRPVFEAMTPKAPFLPPRISHWDTAELYWIVRNGVKYTGMPAWVAPERTDEAWAMTAFLLRLPELDEAEYRSLAWGEVAGEGDTGPARGAPAARRSPAFERVLDNCARCHGRDGAGRGTGAFPRIGGQHRAYLEASLKSYAEGRRGSGIMQTAAAALDESELAALAEHYAAASLPESPGARGVVSPLAELSEEPRGEPEAPAQALRREGERIAREGLPAQGVPACIHCHGPEPVADNPGFPRLAGQHEDYLLVQLALWSAGKRGGSPYARLMTVVARELKPEQQRALAAWYAALTPQGAAGHRHGGASSAGQPRAERPH